MFCVTKRIAFIGLWAPTCATCRTNPEMMIAAGVHFFPLTKSFTSPIHGDARVQGFGCPQRPAHLALVCHCR